MNKDAMPGDSDIPITMGGDEYVLKPSLEACLAISRLAGGLMETRRRIMQLDFDTVCEVLAAGLSLNPGQRQRMLPKLVYETGVINLTGACIDFTLIVGNGGVMPGLEDDEPKEDAADPLVVG